MVSRKLCEVLLRPPMYGLNAAACDYAIGASRYIRITDITDKGKYCPTDNAYVHSTDERYLLKENDIVLARTGASVGKSYLYKKKNGKIIFAGFLIKVSIDPLQADSRFIFECFHTKRYWDWVNSESARSGQPGINGKQYADFVLRLPSLPEQQAIASVLSDFDEHIDNLTELIEKKKAICEGALEDLVSGRTRIDGFDGEWVSIPFKQYFTLLSTNTYSREQLSDNGAIGNIHYGDVLIKYRSVLSENDYIPRLKDASKFSVQQVLKKNDVIIADTAEDETVGKAVQIGDIGIPLVSGLHTMACRPNYPTADGFLGYYINSNCYHDKILPYITGIKVSSISKKSIEKTELRIPVDIKEQQAIAQVLAAMDEEIESLEEEKSKMMQIREGAMDDLLTGRVRLKV